MPAVLEEALDRRFPLDHRRHDLAVFRDVLLANRDQVPVEDAE